jgi:copper homeostasis protein
MQVCIDCGIDRVLTSGQQAKAIDGLACLKNLQAQFGQAIQILVGSGVNAKNAEYIMQETGITNLHSSCKGVKSDPTTVSNAVSFAVTEGNQYDCVDSQVVADLVHCFKQLNMDL